MSIIKALVRLSSFFHKEIVSVLRQPKLLFTLILGPFLIMLLFGIGYTPEQEPVRTALLAYRQEALTQAVMEKKDTLSEQLNITQVSDDPELIMDKLRKGSLDLVLQLPNDPLDTIKQDKQAVIQVFHNEIDPVQSNYLAYLAQNATEMINQQVLIQATSETQDESKQLDSELDKAILATRATRNALQSRNVDEANAENAQRNRVLTVVRGLIGNRTGLLRSLDPQADAASAQAEDDALKNRTDYTNQTAYDQEIEQLNQDEKSLLDLQSKLRTFNDVSPHVMTKPFTTKLYTIQKEVIDTTNFFIPLVIILLLQHMSVTMAALSYVKEQNSGITEVFKISPLKAGEMLISKYLAHLFLGMIIAAVLVALMKFGLRVPMYGSWLDAALVIFLLLAASLGLGNIISLVSQSESGAVQLSMIALLFSVFFSGFFLSLKQISYPVKYLAYTIPATYGNALLQNIMLKGARPDMAMLLGLVALALIFFIVALLFIRRRLKRV